MSPFITCHVAAVTPHEAVTMIRAETKLIGAHNVKNSSADSHESGASRAVHRRLDHEESDRVRRNTEVEKYSGLLANREGSDPKLVSNIIE